MYWNLKQMSEKLQIAVIEDEPITAEFVRRTLQNMGHEVIFICQNAQMALELCIEKKPNLLFLDINLQGAKDGIWLAHEIQRRRLNIGVIFATAYSDHTTVEDAALTMPHSYLVKPFLNKDIQIAVSLAAKKMEAARQKSQKTSCCTKLKIDDDFTFDFEKNILFKNENTIKLTGKELTAVRHFCKKIGSLVTKEELSHVVWSEDISDSTVRDLIYKIRKKAIGLRLESANAIGYILHC